MFVLLMITAPREYKSPTKGAFSFAGLNARLAKPVVESTPSTSKVSLTEIGRPCKGPKGFPVCLIWASRKETRFSATSKRGSVRHRVSWWAIAARCYSVLASVITMVVTKELKTVCIAPNTPYRQCHHVFANSRLHSLRKSEVHCLPLTLQNASQTSVADNLPAAISPSNPLMSHFSVISNCFVLNNPHCLGISITLTASYFVFVTDSSGEYIPAGIHWAGRRHSLGILESSCASLRREISLKAGSGDMVLGNFWLAIKVIIAGYGFASRR